MISALKKLVATDPQDGTTKGDVPDGMHTMGQSLQRRFAKGVQYNSEYYQWWLQNIPLDYSSESLLFIVELYSTVS